MGTVLTLADLNTAVNHEPRIAHQRLAEALGYSDTSMMPRLVERHREALERFGQVSVTVTETGPKGGRPGKIYWLNKKQALYICTKSETANATEATIQMVEVFDAYLKGEIKPVKVREHRRALPAEPQPLPFGADLARDFYEAIMSANVRVERGEEPTFAKALEGVLCDLVTAHVGGIPLSGKVLFGAKVHRAKVRAASNMPTH